MGEWGRGIDVNGKSGEEGQIRDLNGGRGKQTSNLLDGPMTPLPFGSMKATTTDVGKPDKTGSQRGVLG
jgi:hypothetical protein